MSWSSVNTNTYQPLRPIAPPPPPPPPPAPAPAPLGGNTWQPSFLYDAPSPLGAGPTVALGPARPCQQTYQNPDALRQELLSLMQEGAQVDLAADPQVRKLWAYLNQMQPGQLESLKGLVNASQTKVEQIFLLKAFAANEDWNSLVQFANEMRGQPEAEIVRRCTMRDDNDVVQQWQDACGPTVLQTAAGEADPRFAWELNKVYDLSRIDPLGASAMLAEQQKQWLERYGGRAVQRGQTGGTGIALGQMLNDMLTPITGASYSTFEAGNAPAALEQVSNWLRSGFDVPIRISQQRPTGGQDSGHFMLMMAVRGSTGSREFQIHDPWTGKTAWVPEGQIVNNQMAPMFNYARLTHVYTPSSVA